MKKVGFFALVMVLGTVLVLAFAGETRPFAFVVVGDQGCGCPDQQKVASRMFEWHKQHPFEHIMTTGDNIYGGTWGVLWGKRGGHKDYFADRFDKYYRPLLDHGVKFYASLGNHDVETNEGRDEIDDKERFHISGEKGYYSFTPWTKPDGKPLITFFALNSDRMAEGRSDPEQVDWLKRSLVENKSIWKVAYFHVPFYAPPGHHEPDESLRRQIEEVLVSGGVKVVITGHNHFYARMKPIKGITYFISGGGGRQLRTPRKNEITVKAAKLNHFLYMEANEDKILYWAVPSSGPPIDQGTIEVE